MTQASKNVSVKSTLGEIAMQTYLPILLFTFIALIIIGAQYLNYGSNLVDFDSLTADGFSEIGARNGSILGKIYPKIKENYPYGENKGFDYLRIFRRVLIRNTPIGTCYALLWIGEKSFIPSLHILLDVELKPFFLCRKNAQDAYVAGLKTVRTIESHGVILKLNPAFPLSEYGFIEHLVDFIKQKELKNTTITCYNGVITMTPTHINRRERHRFLNEFIGTVVLAAKTVHGNFT